MTILEVIRQIISEKRQSGKMPHHALRLEILKRCQSVSVDEIDDQLSEMCDWNEILCIRTINDVAFMEIEDPDIEATTNIEVDIITNIAPE